MVVPSDAARPSNRRSTIEARAIPLALFLWTRVARGRLCARQRRPEIRSTANSTLLLLRDYVINSRSRASRPPMTVPLVADPRNLRVDAMLPPFPGHHLRVSARRGPPGCDAIVASVRLRQRGNCAFASLKLLLSAAELLVHIRMWGSNQPSASEPRVFHGNSVTRKLARPVGLGRPRFCPPDTLTFIQPRPPGAERVVTLRPNGRPQRFEARHKALEPPTLRCASTTPRARH